MSLLKSAFGDDPIQGGTSIISFGSFGSGKSKLLQGWAIRDFEKGHLVILRSKDVDTWQDLARKYPVHVFTPDFYHFQFDNEKQNSNIKFTMIRRPDDIIQALRRDEINVISILGSEYDSGFFWSWFSHSLVHHSHGWTTFGFDEIRDVFQSHPSGPSFKVYEAFVNSLTSFRKKRIHFRASTHTFHDLYYEILYKFQYTVYLRGSILLPQKRTALETRTPIEEKCDLHHYILDNISEFEVIEHALLPDSLASSNTISVEGPDFAAADFPLELIGMGISPMVECPECGRSFHASSTQATCPMCQSQFEVVDRIAPGTPEIEYDGDNPPRKDAPTPPPPLSIRRKKEKSAKSGVPLGKDGTQQKKVKKW